MQTYTVQPGDTLYGISKQFGVTLEEIRNLNNLSSNTIFVGQVLRIPSVDTTSYYIVKAGDTLYSIASRFNTTVNELIKINNLKGTTLAIGEQLVIPIKGSTDSSEYVIYTVKVGDSLYAIAKKYGVSVDDIRNYNNLKSNLLSIGQQLKIPLSSNTPSTDVNEYQDYVVKAGDTLYSIAVNSGMSVNELIEINKLKSTILSVGQVLKVKFRNTSNIPLGSSCYGTGYKEPTYITYTVKRGDNLYNIAKSYNTSVENLIKLNNLGSNSNLSIGQVLKIREV